jgi:hypothetical protein
VRNLHEVYRTVLKLNIESTFKPNKMKPSKVEFLFPFMFFLLVMSMNGLVAQILITAGPDVTPAMMVEEIVADGVTWDNASFQGADISRGIFTNGQTTSLGLSSGVFLTTGSGLMIPGPNDNGSAGVNNGTPGHPLLTAMTAASTHDAAVLSFDIWFHTDTLQIRYIFGSEEYNEWVGASNTDVFGCFVSGPNPSGGNYTNKNIAVIPGTANLTVNINNLNNGYAPAGVVPTGPCTNCQYYSDNTGGLTLQYDGTTVVMTASIPIVKCETYHIKIGIADVGNGNIDSGVFIETNSLGFYPQITSEIALDPAGLTENLVEGFVGAEVTLKLPHAGYSPNMIFFDIQGTAVNGVDYEWIDSWFTFEEGYDMATVKIVPLSDGIIEGDETVVLVVLNTLGCQIIYDTITLIISDYTEMTTVTSPEPVICFGQDAEIWVTSNNGHPPYTFIWEPGSYTTDTILVSPEETTSYKVICTDLLMQTVTDSILVSVLPGHLNEMVEFIFEATNNPLLPGDIAGTITGDSILVILPSGQDADNLIATFTISDCAEAYVADEVQLSGVTENDFTLPVIYNVMAANGDSKEWVVRVDFSAGQYELLSGNITLFPNPITDKVQIMGAAGYEVSLYSGFGVILLHETIPENKTSLDVRNIEPGIYYLKFIHGDHRFVRKVVVCR